MQPCVLSLSRGRIITLGDNAVTDSGGKHILVLRGKDLFKSTFAQISKMELVGSGLDPMAISMDGKKAIVAKDNGQLQVLSVPTGALNPLMKNGHTAFFLGDQDNIVVVQGGKNAISIVNMVTERSRQVTNWEAYNTIPIPSSNGRFFVFERYDDEFGNTRSVFVYDNESERLELHSSR
jgi:hypothetical protein